MNLTSRLPMTPSNLTPEQIDHLARKRVGAKLGWYIHATVFALVNVGLFALSYYGLRQRPWSVYPFLGWGLGLALHGIAVFVLGQGGGLKEHLIEKERERLRRQQGPR